PTALASLESVQRKELGTSIDIRIRDRAGSYHSVEVRGRDATDDPAIGGVILSLRDLTDRGRWEVAAGNTDLYRSILDHAPGITMVLDAEGRLRGASRALTTLSGRDLETSLGHHVREFVTTPTRRRSRRSWRWRCRSRGSGRSRCRSPPRTARQRCR